jgi:Cu/Ag efflux pump CusA
MPRIGMWSISSSKPIVAIHPLQCLCFPSVDLPTVRILTVFPGASAEEIETQVSQRIEEAVNTVEGSTNCAPSPAKVVPWSSSPSI